MSLNRPTQKQTIFYRLLKNRNEENNRLMPVFEFMGELYLKELGKWGYVSYECSARLSEMVSENPDLIYREYMRGKSGAKYYGYRFKDTAKPEHILDPDLMKIYRVVKNSSKPV